MDKSIRGDVGLITYEFEPREMDKMIWIPGETNHVDPLTKLNSTLCSSLQLLTYSGKLPIDFKEAEERCSYASTG